MKTRLLVTAIVVALMFSLTGCASAQVWAPRHGIVVDLEDTTADVEIVDGDDNDIAHFAIEFQITAYGEDFYIPFGGCPEVTGNENKHPAVECQIETIFGVYGDGTQVMALDSTAEVAHSHYVIREGDSEIFAVYVDMENTDGDTGSYRLRMTALNYRSNPARKDRWYHHPLGPEFKTPYVNLIN